MNQIQNPSSSISYTDKDFQTIYPELLDLVKKLTYKWDPSISNESDPGVILLKLNAIIADKNNYNIDKNILEAFPETVTQRKNAIQLFQQLGYIMQQYIAAQGNISVKFTGEATEADIANKVTLSIPEFTMFSNSDNSLIFTSIDDATISLDGNYSPIPVLQGSKVEYEIAGEKIIQINDLDENNRLYFNDINVAQNGIFIYNVDGNGNPIGYNDSDSEVYEIYWKKVDNLSTEPYNRHVFSFGITQDEQTCYVELPEDISDIINNGIKIVYIKTDGVSGNIAINNVNKVYSSLTFDNYTIDDLTVSNSSPITGGADSESIDQAYKNYKKTIGVFKTLVSLRDYISYFSSLGAEAGDARVSNGFVCDNKTDIQSAYYAISRTDIDEDMQTKTPVYTRYYYNNPSKMDTFDLSLYLLQYSPVTYSNASFNKTFELITDTQAQQDYLQQDGVKHIQHEFKNITTDCIQYQHDYLPSFHIKANLCMIKNKFPVKVTVVPISSVTDIEKAEIQNNIINTLRENLNASQMEFGVEPSYEKVVDIIKSADNRIRNVTLQDFEYTTYATVYFIVADNNGEIFTQKFIDVPIDDAHYINTKLFPTDSIITSEMCSDLISDIRIDIVVKSVLAGKTQFLVKENNINYQLYQTGLQFNEVSNIQNQSSIIFGNLKTFGSDKPITYTLQDCEQLVLTAPSLIDEITYSNYVKFEAQLNNSIQPNTEYQLKAADGDTNTIAEYLIFYWKANSENNYYNYKLYGPGTIVRSNFLIPNTNHLVYTLDSENAATQYWIYGHMLRPNSYTTPISGITQGLIAGIEGEAPTEETEVISLTDAIYNSTDTIITGSNEIKIRKINKQTLNSTENNNYCYWVLNKETEINGSKYYVLVEDGTPLTDHAYEYELKNNEYLFYTNKSNTYMGYFGSGTLIKIIFGDSYDTVPTNTNLAVPVIDISEILENGPEAFTQSDFYIIGSKPDAPVQSIEVTEQQIIQLSGGTTVQLKNNSPLTEVQSYSSDNDFIITSAPTGLVGDNYDITLSYIVNDAYTTLTNYDIPEVSWKIREAIQLDTTASKPASSNIINTTGTPAAYISSVTYYPGDVIQGGLDSNLLSQCISTTSTGAFNSNDWTDLVAYNSFKLGITYNALATVSSTVIQPIYSVRQSNFYMLSTPNIQALVENELDPSLINISSNLQTIYPTLYTYASIAQASWNSDVVYMTATSSTFAASPSFLLPAGNYFIKASTASDVLLDSTQTSPIQIAHASIIYPNVTNTSYLPKYIFFTTTGTQMMDFAIKTSNTDATITFSNLIKYDPNSIALDSTLATDKILPRLAELDSDNMFDYLYTVPTSDLVENPLEASSFFNTSHIYNQFTIAQLDTEEFKLNQPSGKQENPNVINKIR